MRGFVVSQNQRKVRSWSVSRKAACRGVGAKEGAGAGAGSVADRHADPARTATQSARRRLDGVVRTRITSRGVREVKRVDADLTARSAPTRRPESR